MNRLLLCAAVLTGLSTAAGATSYHYKQAAPGLASAVAAPQAPVSAVGDGVSKAGACAVGAATGCATMVSTTNFAVTNNGLTVSYGGGFSSAGAKANVSKSSGKWYWEVTSVSAVNPLAPASALGIVLASFNTASANNCWGCTVTNVNGASSPFIVLYHGTYGGRPLSVVNSSSASYAAGTTAGFALDLDAKTLTLTINGIPRWTVSGIPAGTVWAPVVSTGGNTHTDTFNFGQSSFNYAVPAGYNAGMW